MKLHPFARDVGILTEEELEYIDEQIVETYRTQLKARNIFPVRTVGEGMGGEQYYKYYDEQDPGEAAIDMTGKAGSYDHPEKTLNTVTMPVIHKESFLNWREYASSRKQGTSLLDDCIRTATRKVAEAEDKLLISGEYTGWDALGIEGLFTATGRTNNAASGNWPANVEADINTARAALDAAGFEDRTPIMVGPPAVINGLDEMIANTATTYKQALMDNGLIADFIKTSNAYAADGGVDSVVLVVPGTDSFYAVQDLPLEYHLWYDKVQNIYLTVRETIAPVITRPEAIAEINTITIA